MTECGARHSHFPAVTSTCTQPIGHDGPHVSIDDYIQWEDAEPPSIDAMAPGTTFTARLEHGTESRRFERTTGKWPVRDTGRFGWDISEFDPSTIRNVTPPPEKETNA